MKQLDFTLSLIDKLSRPLKQAQSSVTGFAEKSKAAFMQIGGGVLALAGTGMAIRGALSPAIEMYDALNDAASKGIDDQALKAVQRDALRFSTTYGASAVEFVQSTESINSAIAGLTGNELPKVTKVANTLAFALKSTAAETAEFMGQMFGNFSADAERLGKVQFAEQLAGKMVYMRKVFGTEMGTIKDLMEGARGVGTNYGVGLDEQLAVLGQLNRTLGTEASSAYEGFMTGAIEGGKKLGLSFTDATGKMLSMPEMLIKLQGKYGKSLEGNLKAQEELDAAFGDSSAVVKHLYGNVALLQRNITELGGSDGLKRTQEMASKLVKPWDRFVQILKAIQTVIGLTLIPVLYPVLNRLADMGQTFARWMQLFPNIARVIGYAAMALLGFAAVGAVANIVMGASKFIMAGLRGIWVAMTAVTKAYTAMVWLAQIAVIAWNATLKFLRGALLAVRMAAIMAGIGINLMSWPVLLVIGAMTCTPALLNLLAYDRDISRFDGEPLELFRRRVAYAFVNARDAGSVEGFISIFERLGIGYVELMERQPGIDWDVIQVRVTDSQIATNTQLMIQIIRQYGRTCRRYQFEVITSERLTIRAGWDQGEYVVYPAALSGTETNNATYSAGL